MFDINFIKKHLNIDEDFSGDDLLLEFYMTSAKKIVEKHLNKPLATIKEENNGVLPKPLELCMLFLIANMYMQRESITSTSLTEVPQSYNYILDLYKCYYNDEV